MGMSAYNLYVFFILSLLRCWYLLAAWVWGKQTSPRLQLRGETARASVTNTCMAQGRAKITDPVTLFCFTPGLMTKLPLIQTWESKKVSTTPWAHIYSWADLGTGVQVVAVLASTAATLGCGLKAELVLTRTTPRNQNFLHTMTLRSFRTLSPKMEIQFSLTLWRIWGKF